jgi:hypothetical protein
MHKRKVTIAAVEEILGGQAGDRRVVHGHARQRDVRAAFRQVHDRHLQTPQARPHVPPHAQQRHDSVTLPVLGNGIIEIKRHMPVVVAGETGYSAVHLRVVPTERQQDLAMIRGGQASGRARLGRRRSSAMAGS